MKCKNTSIKDPEQLPQIIDIIHDCLFDVTDILFNSEESVLSIKFRREAVKESRMIEKIWFLKKWEIPTIECYLKFHHVKNYRIKDTERVGIYNFDELEYDPNLQCINITTGVPIEIKISVERFEVSVKETDKVIETKTITSVFNLAE